MEQQPTKVYFSYTCICGLGFIIIAGAIGLEVCISHKLKSKLMLKPYAQCDDIWRWKVFGRRFSQKRGAFAAGVSALIRQSPEGFYAPSSM